MDTATKETKLIVFDLDWTLYDFSAYYAPALKALVKETSDLTGLDSELILDNLMHVYDTHHDVEHPNALFETNIIQENYPNASINELKHIFEKPIKAYNDLLDKSLHTYPKTQEMLEQLKEEGYKLVVYTDAKHPRPLERLEKLGLTEYFDKIYCREQADTTDSSIEHHLVQQLPNTKEYRKPAPDMLRNICKNMGAKIENTYMVGDCLHSDISMAKDAGATTIWAKYAIRHINLNELATMERVMSDRQEKSNSRLYTNWSTAASKIQPDHTAHNGPEDILSILSLVLKPNITAKPTKNHNGFNL